MPRSRSDHASSLPIHSMRNPEMVDPIAAWHTDHVYFRRLLNLLDGQLAVFHTGESPNYELMRDIVYYLREFSDQVHHPREDVAFARLAKRSLGIDMELNRLSQEHRVIARAGQILLQSLEGILGGAIIPRADMEAAAATYLVYYRNHIAAEEREILPRAGRLLTAEDWQAVAAAVPAVNDPLFGDDPQDRFRELRREISRET